MTEYMAEWRRDKKKTENEPHFTFDKRTHAHDHSRTKKKKINDKRSK